MSTLVSEEQVRQWLDETVVQDVTDHTDDETAFNLEIQLSRLPIHLIKEESTGPVRVVGRSGFDTDHSRRLLREDERRGEFLRYVGPMLAATPGFYTFLDEEGLSCALENAETIQVEYRLYPDGASQQALMDATMAIGTSMRYVQNVVGALRPRESTSDSDS